LVDGLALLKGSKSITGKVRNNQHQRDLVILGDSRSFALFCAGGETPPEAKPNDEKVEELQDART
jgi:hypothetical protein